MFKKFLDLFVPYIGFVIMFSIAIIAFEDNLANLPRYYLPFALGAVLFIGGFVMLIGLMPIWMHALDSEFDVPMGAFKFLDYRESKDFPGKIIGPFGLGASVLSLFVPLSIGLTVGIYLNFRSKNVIKIRQRSKEIEKEFASGLFQLGNRIADGLPLEMAFGL